MTVQSPSGGDQTSPGWAARILFWAAVATGPLRHLAMLQMVVVGVDPEVFYLFSILPIMASVLELVLGICALLLVRSSPMTMRLLGSGLFLLAGVYAWFVPHLIAAIANLAVDDFALMVDTLTMSIQSVIWAFHGGVVLAGMLVAWNIARNRAWWMHLIAAGYAMLMGLVVSFVEFALNTFGSSFATSVVLTQLVSLALTFVGLGVLHLLGSLRVGPETAKGPPTLE